MKYNHRKVESKWQVVWEEREIFKTSDSQDTPKFYCLDMFPYPSGSGLHVGHPRGYMASDIISRYKKMKGFNVLHPMGWDAFGLPAENHALKTGIQPQISTEDNIARFKNQIRLLGLSYDWTREINTTDPKYYKWTQWIFIKLFEKGLAYESNLPINWCPSCKTGLANEEVVNGECERCGTKVGKKDVRQWVLKITKYADRLLNDLDLLDWPEKIKEMQRNWIGRSEGADIIFKSDNEDIKIFTTRPDTIFGATLLILAPEHPFIKKKINLIQNGNEVKRYIEQAKEKTDIERSDITKEKTGVEMKGLFAVNPANGENIPIWVADYVLSSYGYGAIMSVPAHDDRDYEFAKKHGCQIREVISGSKAEGEIYTGLHHGARESIEQKPAGIPQTGHPFAHEINHRFIRHQLAPLHVAQGAFDGGRAFAGGGALRRPKNITCGKMQGPQTLAQQVRLRAFAHAGGAQQNQPPRPASAGGRPATGYRPAFNPCRIVPFLCHKKDPILPDRLHCQTALSAIRNPPTVKPLPRTSPISRLAKKRESSDNRDRKKWRTPRTTAPRHPIANLGAMRFWRGRPAFTAPDG